MTSYEAVDPSDLERGDEVVIQDVDDDQEIRGNVEKITTEAGRYGITVLDEDGQGWTCWERTGRTWTRVVEDKEGEDR